MNGNGPEWQLRKGRSDSAGLEVWKVAGGLSLRERTNVCDLAIGRGGMFI